MSRIPEIQRRGPGLVRGSTLKALRDRAIRPVAQSARTITQQTGQDTFVNPIAPVRGFGRYVEQFVVLGEDADVLFCRAVSGWTGAQGEDVIVAKPWTLRATVFDGVTVNYGDGLIVGYSYDTFRLRTAIVGEDEFTEAVTPSYIANPAEVILGMRVSAFVLDGVGEIEWVDVNTAARAWARLEVVEE